MCWDLFHYTAKQQEIQYTELTYITARFNPHHSTNPVQMMLLCALPAAGLVTAPL